MIAEITAPVPREAAATENLTNQLRSLPEEAFTRMQYLQPQIGCFNRCTFCSQGAGSDVWELEYPELSTLFSSIKTVATEIAVRHGKATDEPLVGYERTGHRPGVIFPYMDNDVSSYPHLYDFARLTRDELQAKIRISTVGYSRHNEELQAMHKAINTDLKDAFAGVRFSFTPYTYGMTEQADRTDGYSNEEYLADFANALRTYRPIIEEIGPSKSTGCVELRFAPQAVAEDKELEEGTIGGRHYVKSGSHVLIAKEAGKAARRTKVEAVDGNTPVFDQQASSYYLVTSDIEVGEQDDVTTVVSSLEQRGFDPDAFNGRADIKEVQVYEFDNAEGAYLSVNPNFAEDGHFTNMNFYRQTDTRTRSGYTDATRHFLNALMDYKKERGIGRREEFAAASWNDVRGVIDMLGQRAEDMAQWDKRGAAHVRKNVISMVEKYAQVLAAADYPPAYFFSRNFTVDTGQIVNQGRAVHLFNGLTRTEDLPMNPREERGYGDVSLSTVRGAVWRWSPAAVEGEKTLTIGRRGKKNHQAAAGTITVQALDTRTLTSKTPEGIQLPEYTIKGVGNLHKTTLFEGTDRRLVAGVKVKSE